MNNFATRLRTAFLRALWNKRGVHLAEPVRIDPQVDLVAGVSATSARGEITCGSNCHFSRGVVMHAYGGAIRVGRNVFIGPYAVIYGHGGVEIGDHVLISMHCRILSSNHAIPAPGVPIRSQPDVLKPTRIGADVWLGAGVTVLAGVTIGSGCVVGAGAVVTHNLPENTIALGIPARVVGMRGSEPPRGLPEASMG